jgi:hypothetical protein
LKKTPAVAFSGPEHSVFVVGAVTASERSETVVGWAGIEPPSPLECASAEVVMKGVNENRYLLHALLRGIQELIA